MLGAGLTALAAITTGSSLLLAIVPIGLALRRYSWPLLRSALTATADLVAVPAVAFATAALMLDAWS